MNQKRFIVGVLISLVIVIGVVAGDALVTKYESSGTVTLTDGQRKVQTLFVASANQMASIPMGLAIFSFTAPDSMWIDAITDSTDDTTYHYFGALDTIAIALKSSYAGITYTLDSAFKAGTRAATNLCTLRFVEYRDSVFGDSLYFEVTWGDTVTWPSTRSLVGTLTYKMKCNLKWPDAGW